MITSKDLRLQYKQITGNEPTAEGIVWNGEKYIFDTIFRSDYSNYIEEKLINLLNK